MSAEPSAQERRRVALANRALLGWLIGVPGFFVLLFVVETVPSARTLAPRARHYGSRLLVSGLVAGMLLVRCPRCKLGFGGRAMVTGSVPSQPPASAASIVVAFSEVATANEARHRARGLPQTTMRNAPVPSIFRLTARPTLRRRARKD